MSLRYLSGVTTLELATDKCTGCGMCTEVCPHGVFAVEDRKARIADPDACMECGACARNCPAQAVSVNSGVGCAAKIIGDMLRGSEGECGCSKTSGCC